MILQIRFFAVFLPNVKVIFAELRPNFLALCYFNESTGTSRKFSAIELAALDLDITDCPGVYYIYVWKSSFSNYLNYRSGKNDKKRQSFLSKWTLGWCVFGGYLCLLTRIYCYTESVSIGGAHLNSALEKI